MLETTAPGANVAAGLYKIPTEDVPALDIVPLFVTPNVVEFSEYIPVELLPTVITPVLVICESLTP